MALPRIRTRRLSLRPFAVSDVDALHALWTDPLVRRWLWDDEVIPRERAAEVVAASVAGGRDGAGAWCVSVVGEPGLAGFCALMPLGDELELLYGLAPHCWGRGLAVEAARAVLSWVFATSPRARVWAGADAPNTRSLAVMERLGMRPAPPPAPAPAGVLYRVLDREGMVRDADAVWSPAD